MRGVPSRRGDEALSVPAHGHGPAGGLVADRAAVVGEHEVERRARVELERPLRLVDVVRPGEPDERADGVTRLVGAPREREGLARARLRPGDDGAVTRHDDLLDDRLAASAHGDLLPHDLGLHPGAVGLVAARLEALDEEILRVEKRRRRTPGDVLVAAEDDERDARDGEAGDGMSIPAQVLDVPEHRHGEMEVRVVREQRLPALRARAGDDPVVRRAVPDQAPQAGAALLRFRHERPRDDRGRMLGERRVEAARPLLTQPARHPHAHELGLPVHALAVGRDERPALRIESGRLAVRRPAQEPPHEAVELEHADAGELGQAAGAEPADHLHLEEPVLGVDVALRAQGVGEGGGVDVREAEAVAHDLGGRLEASELRPSVRPRGEKPRETAD